MTTEAGSGRMTPVGGSWWAAYVEDGRGFVVPILCFDESGAPYVWSADTHRPVPAVRTAFVGVVSDSYRGEYGDVIALAIKSATSGHAGEAYPKAHHDGNAGSDDANEKLRDGIEKVREATPAPPRSG